MRSSAAMCAFTEGSSACPHELAGGARRRMATISRARHGRELAVLAQRLYSRIMRNAWISWIVLVSVVTWSPSAAHAGPVEQLQQLIFQPGKPDNAILIYVNGGDGMFFTHDGVKSFELLCSSAIDPALVHGGPTILTADGKTLMGVFDGMYEDDGTGCNWSRVDELAGFWVTDFAIDPLDSSITYTVTANGNPGSMNGIFKRDKDDQWTEVGTREDILIGRVHVIDVGGGKLRFYESIARGQRSTGGSDAGIVAQAAQAPLQTANRTTSSAFRTTQARPGKSTRSPSTGNASMRLVAIDPTNPDHSWSPSIATTKTTASSSATTKVRPSPSIWRSRRSAA